MQLRSHYLQVTGYVRPAGFKRIRRIGDIRLTLRAGSDVSWIRRGQGVTLEIVFVTVPQLLPDVDKPRCSFPLRLRWDPGGK